MLDGVGCGKGRNDTLRGSDSNGGRVERRRVAGRVWWAHPVLSQPGRSPIPMGTFPPPLSEPGGPISGTGLSSGIMRLAHGFPVAANGRVSRAVAPGPHPCAGRPVCRQAC